MTEEDFVRDYERALSSQSWDEVEPLVHENACVTFSDGSVHKGRRAVGDAFARNFSSIEDERYRITNVHWVTRTERVAVYLFDFAWTGKIGGRPASGSGRGTSVITRDGNSWQLLVEHLGAAPA